MTAATTSDCDVLIAGAGLVGLALAPALAGAGLKVTLADRAPVVTPEPPPAEGGWDARVYAISPGSASFLRALGAWQSLPVERIVPIETMRVVGDDGSALNFSAYELGERALAWIVEERALKAALVPLVRESGVTICAPRAFASIAWSADAGLLHFDDGTAVSARLIVGADGVRSAVREAAGITAVPKPYGQTAVVANFACERAHHGRAHQWFRADGSVLAWLPLPGRRVSIVWSAGEALAQELLALSPVALAARVVEAGGSALGAFECITPAAGFPLHLLQLPAVVAHRLALVGDAAHGIHPLAGQGVNLGFGDVEALAAVLRERGPVADAGAPLLLDRYARQRALPVRTMQTVTDALAHLFRIKAPWIRSARNLGLAAVDRLPPARRLLAQSALR
jgi:ubiquinone biosynthesis UbiH/UbiF/VisC/COQ6 family hydroxylase